MSERFEKCHSTAELFGTEAFDQLRNGQFAWLVGSSVSTSIMCDHGGTNYFPAALDPTLDDLLPAELGDYVDTGELVQAMSASAREILGASDLYALILAATCLSSWVPECLLGGAPILNFWGPPDRRATTLAFVLALWRRPMPLLDPSIEALAELPRHFYPTVVVSDPSTASLAKLSLAVGQNVAGILRRGRLVKARCSLVVFTALPSPSIRLRIPLSAFAPTRGLTPRDAGELRRRFEGNLVRYRLAQHAPIVRSSFAVGGHAPGVMRLVDQLSPALAGASAVQLEFEQAMKVLDEEEKSSRCQSEEAVAVEALLLPCHEQRPSAMIGELSEIANTILIERGERAVFTPKKYGVTLRRLALPAKRQAAGFELTFDAWTCRRVHELGQALGVLALSKPFDGCSHCSALFAGGSTESDASSA